MFFSSSVLCTHLDVEITRWILNRVELFRKKKKGTRGDQLSSQPVFLPVFLSSEQIAKLSMERKPLTQDVIQLLEPRVPMKYHYVLNPVDPKEGEFVTLCIFFKEKITLAIIMDLRNLLDSRDIRVIGMNHGLEGRLGNLERDMLSSLYKTKSSSNVLGQFSAGVDDSSCPFHYLTTDSLTGMTKGSILKKDPDSLTEKEDRFLLGSSYVHEAYTNSQISKVMLGFVIFFYIFFLGIRINHVNLFVWGRTETTADCSTVGTCSVKRYFSKNISPQLSL